MDPVSTTVAVMTGVNHAFNLAKNLKDLDLKLNEAESKNKIADLYSSLSEVKVNAAELRVELLSKDEEIRNLREELKVKGQMKFERPFYYLIDNNIQEKSGPYCPQCYDSDRKIINLHNYSSTWWECMTCEKRWDKDPTRTHESKMDIIRGHRRSDWDDVE